MKLKDHKSSLIITLFLTLTKSENTLEFAPNSISYGVN